MTKKYDIALAWNQRVGLKNAHIEWGEEKGWLFGWYTSVSTGMNYKNKKIVDYGIGGGLFYEWLTTNYPIKSYVGYDIAPRALEAFKKKAEALEFKNYKTILIKPYEIPDLNPDKDADILFAIAVLQHAPDQDYYDYLLSKFNDSKIKQLVISFKYAEKITFRDTPYKTTHDIAHSCYTNVEDIQKCLTNYKLNAKFNNTNAFVCFNLKAVKKIEEESQV